jgi:hypothetical protein
MSSNDKDGLPNEFTTASADLMESLGGDPLEGSGFEDEIPQSDSEWEDPR